MSTPILLIAYSQTDEAWKQRLADHFQGAWNVQTLATSPTSAGEPLWSPELEHAVAGVSAILLVISPAALHSQIANAPGILKTRFEEGVPLAAVIVEDCPWQEIDWWRGARTWPREEAPLSTLGEAAMGARLTALSRELLAEHRQLSYGPRGGAVVPHRGPPLDVGAKDGGVRAGRGVKGPALDPSQPLEGEGASHQIVPVYYGTDRALTGKAKPNDVYGADRGELTFGIAQVSIPTDHRLGELERPKLWKLEFSEDPDKHVVVQDVSPFDRDDFVQRLRGATEASA